MTLNNTTNLKRDIILSDITDSSIAFNLIYSISQNQLNKDADTNENEALECIEEIVKYTLETQKN